jgi:tetratricopeptide (TPR) repeat protein
LNLKAKYKGAPEVDQERPRHELDIMNDWLSQHKQKDDRSVPVNEGIPTGISSSEEYRGSKADFTKYFYMGIALFESGQYQDSVDCFGKALKINPKHKEALKYLLKAFYYVKQGNKQLA